MEGIKNIISIDLEEWFHANLLDNISIDRSDPSVRRIERNTNILLALFDKYEVKATFFVLGWVAEHYPDLVLKIHKKGHEIASHGYAHKIVYNMTKGEFVEDIKKSIEFIEQATGVKPRGFRAPSWSVTKQTKWIYEILSQNGFVYDASIFPVKNFLYGIPDAPRFPFEVVGADYKMIEFPTTTLRFLGKNFPFSGGFYFRALPYYLIKQCYSTVNRMGKPVMFYLHPRDFDYTEPIVADLNIRDRFIHYYGLKSCFKKIEQLLHDFQFGTIDDYRGNVMYPTVAVSDL